MAVAVGEILLGKERGVVVHLGVYGNVEYIAWVCILHFSCQIF